MTAVKRSLKYWGYSIEILLLPAFFMIALLTLFEYAGGGLEEALAYLVNMTPMLCIIIMAMLGFVGISTYFPFAMSMGSTRKANFVAMEVMVHFMALQITVLTAVINIVHANVCGDGKNPYTIVTYGFWIFLSGGICNVIGSVAVKCKKMWTMVMYILFAVIGGIGLTAIMEIAKTETISMGVQVACMAGSLVFDILMCMVFYLVIRKYEVRV